MGKHQATTIENYESEDVFDSLKKIEASFGIRFDYDEDFCSGMTFGKLCNIVDSKITASDTEGCTSQQAFYKIRSAISETQGISKNTISHTTPLSYIFPREYRRQFVYAFEKRLGCNLNILTIHNYIGISLSLLFPASIIVLFFGLWQLALTGLIAAILGFIIAEHCSKELHFPTVTVGALVSEMNKYHYQQSRRNPGTVNRREIKKLLQQILIEDFALDPPVLTDDTKLW